MKIQLLGLLVGIVIQKDKLVLSLSNDEITVSGCVRYYVCVFCAFTTNSCNHY